MTTQLNPSTAIENINGYVSLDDLCVIEATGADVISFLHNQLTQDLMLLPSNQGRLAAYCSAKGRVLASFYIIKITPEKILLICKKDAIESTVKRLKMFVLRAKVQLTDATAQYPLWGLIGNTVNGFFPLQNNQATAPWTAVVNEKNSVLSLYPAQQLARAILVGPLNDSIKNTTKVITKNQWDLCNILSGVTLIGQKLADAFVPQMINYESIGGVNFKKGCYPGQEVVARSQFRGTLKRRLYLCASTRIANVGQELRLTSEPEQSCGTVVEAVSISDQQCLFLASMQIAAADKATPFDAPQDSSELQLITSVVEGNTSNQQIEHAVKILPLPYELLTDI